MATLANTTVVVGNAVTPTTPLTKSLPLISTKSISFPSLNVSIPSIKPLFPTLSLSNHPAIHPLTLLPLRLHSNIVAVDGVDCIQMDPLDLSASAGYLYDPGHKKVREMLRTAEKRVIKSNTKNGGGAFLAGFAMPHDPPKELGKRGYQMVSGCVDIGLFRNATVEDVRKFQMSLEVEEEDDKDSDEKYWSE